MLSLALTATTVFSNFSWNSNANVRAAETENVVEETQVEPAIAEAGFTAVQTSPAQRDDSFGVWYMLYQPQSFSISTNALGSKFLVKNASFSVNFSKKNRMVLCI